MAHLEGIQRVTAALAEVGVSVRIDDNGNGWLIDTWGVDPRLCYKASLIARKLTADDLPIEDWARAQIQDSCRPQVWRRWLNANGIEVA